MRRSDMMLPMHVEQLLDTAAATTGLDDFGEPSF